MRKEIKDLSLDEQKELSYLMNQNILVFLLTILVFSIGILGLFLVRFDDRVSFGIALLFIMIMYIIRGYSSEKRILKLFGVE